MSDAEQARYGSIDLPDRSSIQAMPSNGVLASFARFWQRSYASDYVAIALLIAAYVLIQLFVEPFHRMFFLDNLAIQYPHAEVERVPVFWLFVYALFVPIGVLLILTLVISTRSPHKTHVALLGLAIAFILTSVLTDIIKNAVGRPRPDLIARCQPRKGTPAHELVTYEVCTQKDHHVLHDGWRSFPSGHSSSAFSGLGYLSLVLAGQLHVFRPRTDLSKALISILPLVGAALIAISRCEDYRHDVWDVTAGSIVGFTVALFSYRRYFPSLRKRNCDSPYPTPGEMMTRTKSARKARDEEELATVSAAQDFDLGSDSEEDGVREERLPLTSAATRSNS